MTAHAKDIRTTRTGELAAAAFYYAQGLRFSAFEMRSPEGHGGASNINFVFSGGPEVTSLSDQFYTDNPDVTLAEIKAFVAVLSRRLRSRSLAEGGTR
jgi:hypothetical protein